MVYLQYAICTLVIVFAGAKLSKYADVIADRTVLGRGWVGLVLLATVTSLPELATGISSVLHELPEIAVGDVLGSCMFNLLILAVIDILSKDTPLAARLNRGHAFYAGCAIVMLGAAAVDLILPRPFTIGFVDIFSLLMIPGYVVAIWLSYNVERNLPQQEEREELAERVSPQMSLRRAILFYCITALVVIIAGSFLPAIAEEFARQTGLTRDFVGTAFVALSTSLPELVVTISAARLGAFEMAAGNVLGSNLFNMLVLGIDDFFYTAGPLLGAVEQKHALSAIGGIIMSAIVVISIAFRAHKKLLFTSWEAISLVLLFAAFMSLAF